MFVMARLSVCVLTPQVVAGSSDPKAVGISQTVKERDDQFVQKPLQV